MSLEIKNKKCAVCQAYLFEDEEIVWCPTCGAPQHKECYKQFGKCGYTDIHGTKELEEILKAEKQEEKKEEPKVEVNLVECPACHTKYERDLENCPECSAENLSGKMPTFFAFDFLGGVKPNQDIGEGVTAEKAKRFVMTSTHKIIPKFLAFKNGAKKFFSWWAFLFPAANFAARKMYGAAVLSGIVETAGLLLLFPFNLAMNELELTTGTKLYEYLEKNATKEFFYLTALAFVGVSVLVLYRLFSGFAFDKIYYKHTIAKIKKIEAEYEKEDIPTAFRKYGGYNIFGFILTEIIVQYLPGIIAAFII